MSGPAFQVDPASLGAHANTVNYLGDGLTRAADAGHVVQTDAGAYGQLCQFVPAVLNQLQQAMVDCIGTAAASMQETAAALWSVAAAYDRADTASADSLRHTR